MNVKFDHYNSGGKHKIWMMDYNSAWTTLNLDLTLGIKKATNKKLKPKWNLCSLTLWQADRLLTENLYHHDFYHIREFCDNSLWVTSGSDVRETVLISVLFSSECIYLHQVNVKNIWAWIMSQFRTFHGITFVSFIPHIYRPWEYNILKKWDKKTWDLCNKWPFILTPHSL